MPLQTCALPIRSEEHTSELQSHDNLVCRLLLENDRLDERDNQEGLYRQERLPQLFRTRPTTALLMSCDLAPATYSIHCGQPAVFFVFKNTIGPQGVSLSPHPLPPVV